MGRRGRARRRSGRGLRAGPGWVPCDTPSQIRGPGVVPQAIPVERYCPGGLMELADPEVAAYIARWRPSSVSPQAAAFARQVVPLAAPAGEERGEDLLWAAGQRGAKR